MREFAGFSEPSGVSGLFDVSAVFAVSEAAETAGASGKLPVYSGMSGPRSAFAPKGAKTAFRSGPAICCQTGDKLNGNSPIVTGRWLVAGEPAACSGVPGDSADGAFAPWAEGSALVAWVSSAGKGWPGRTGRQGSDRSTPATTPAPISAATSSENTGRLGRVAPANARARASASARRSFRRNASARPSIRMAGFGTPRIGAGFNPWRSAWRASRRSNGCAPESSS